MVPFFMEKSMEELNILFRYRKKLTRQQFKTLKGQMLHGDKTGAIKGLHKLLNAKKGVKYANRTSS